jgi:hypothetical protein
LSVAAGHPATILPWSARVVQTQQSEDRPIVLSAAAALALLLLLSVAVISLLVEPRLVFRAAMLAGVVVLFIGMRHGIGNWMRRRFFMSTDFEDVSLRDVLEVQASPTERRPVHFVATIVRTKAHDGVYRG